MTHRNFGVASRSALEQLPTGPSHARNNVIQFAGKSSPQPSRGSQPTPSQACATPGPSCEGFYSDGTGAVLWEIAVLVSPFVILGISYLVIVGLA